MFRRFRQSKGATTVEFAFVLPIFFLFLFASLDFMRACNLLHTADNAAYEGARRGIVPGSTALEVENVARGVLATMGASGAAVTVTPAVIEPTTVQVTVDIAIPMNQNGFVVTRFFSNRVIEASMTMTREEFAQTNVP
jgi:Flp pilus assembly protein TadG